MYSNRYQGNKGLIIVTRSGDNPYLKRGSRLSSFIVRRMFTKGDFKPVSSYDLSPGSGVPFHRFLTTETDKEQRIYEEQHSGILLLNIP